MEWFHLEKNRKHNIFEYSYNLSDQYKFNKRNKKIILRNLLSKYIPNNLIDNPKRGFSVPIDNWLRGPLNNFMYSKLNKKNINKYSILDYSYVKDCIKGFENNDYKSSVKINLILNFQMWCDQYYD